MIDAINFDRERSFTAVEIEKVWPRGILSPELEPVLTISQEIPNNAFGDTHLLAKSSCRLGRSRGSVFSLLSHFRFRRPLTPLPPLP